MKRSRSRVLLASAGLACTALILASVFTAQAGAAIPSSSPHKGSRVVRLTHERTVRRLRRVSRRHHRAVAAARLHAARPDVGSNPYFGSDEPVIIFEDSEPNETVFLEGEEVDTTFTCSNTSPEAEIISCEDSEGNEASGSAGERTGYGTLDTSKAGDFQYVITELSREEGFTEADAFEEPEYETKTIFEYEVLSPVAPSASITSPSLVLGPEQVYAVDQVVNTSFSCVLFFNNSP